MHRLLPPLRPGRRAQPWLHVLSPVLTVAALCLAFPAHAAPKDEAAVTLHDEAMDEHWLNVQYDKALSTLDKALDTCGSKGCSKEVVGKLHVARGIVFASKNDMSGAKDAFIAAVKADPNAKPDELYMTPEAKKVFEEAKKEAATAPPSTGDDDEVAPAAGGDLDYDPPSEARINTPLPIFVEAAEDLGAEGMIIRYKPFGATKWFRVKMRPMGGGFGGIIPCDELTTLGDLRLYVIVEDSAGDPIATAGTRKRPLVIKIKNKVDEQPSFPGEEPPGECLTASDCPPDFPGCEPKDTGDRGDKGWGASCEENKECRSGLVCLNGVCEQGEGGDDDDDDGGGDGGGMKHFVSLGLQLDVLNIGTTESVCGEADSADDDVAPVPGFACFTEDDEPFTGRPTDDANSVQGGAALASLRILAGYDLVYWKGIGAGLRIGGVPWGGSPATENGSFVPFHAELRVLQVHPGYFLREDGIAGGAVHPYAFVGIGFAHVDAGVTTRVCDLVDDDGNPVPAGESGGSSCPDGTESRDVTAFFRTGDAFLPIGLGGTFLFNPDSAIKAGINVELKMMVMFGNGGARDTGFAFAPSLGPVLEFE